MYGSSITSEDMTPDPVHQSESRQRGQNTIGGRMKWPCAMLRLVSVCETL